MKISQRVSELLSGNKIMMDRQKDRQIDRQGDYCSDRASADFIWWGPNKHASSLTAHSLFFLFKKVTDHNPQSVAL